MFQKQLTPEQIAVMQQWAKGDVETPGDPFAAINGGPAWNPVTQRTEKGPLPGEPVEMTMPKIIINDATAVEGGEES